jgi:hypothetical protein
VNDFVPDPSKPPYGEWLFGHKNNKKQAWMQKGGVTPPPPSSGITISREAGPGPVRIGDALKVVNTTGRPLFVQIKAPFTDDYEEQWVDLDGYNPEINWVADFQHLGHRLRVVGKGLDANGRPNQQDVYSNEIGPILHETDPVPSWVNGYVNTPAELAARAAAGDAVIVLAPGTVWDGAAFSIVYSNGRITTPQDNPAKIFNSYIRPTAWNNVDMEGIPCCYTRDWSVANRSEAFKLTGASSNVELRGCRQIGPHVTKAEYQAVPADIANSPYRGIGMNFLPDGFHGSDSRNFRVVGHYCANVWQGLYVAADARLEHVRIHRWYWDGLWIIATGALPTFQFYARDVIISDPVGVYDERDYDVATSTGNAPHPDAIQLPTGTFIIKPQIHGFIYCVGDTRARSRGTLTCVICNSQMRNAVFSRVAASGIGSIDWYQGDTDCQIDKAVKVGLHGNGGKALRFGNSLKPYANEYRVSRSTLLGDATLNTPTPSAYSHFLDSVIAANGDIEIYTYGEIGMVAPDVSSYCLLSRPRPGFEYINPLDANGHMSPHMELVPAPGMTVTPTPGGADIVIAPVFDVVEYSIRYRPTGGDDNSKWAVSRSLSPEFSLSLLGSEITYDIQSHVTTGDTVSFWSDVETFQTGAIDPIVVPTLTWEGGGGIVPQFDTVNTGTNRTFRIPIAFAEAPNGVRERISVSFYKTKTGVSSSINTFTNRFADIGVDDAKGDITEVSSRVVAPGGQGNIMRIGLGTPEAGADGVYMYQSALGRFAAFHWTAIASALLTVGPVGNSAAAGLTLPAVPPGSIIVIMGVKRSSPDTPMVWTVSDGTPLATTLVFSDVEAADSRVEIVTVNSPLGGNITISCAQGENIVAASFYETP